MALANLTCLRRVRFVFVIVALLFIVSNVRSLAGRAFGPPAFRPAAAFNGRGVGSKAATAEGRGAQSAWVRRGSSARTTAAARRLVAAFNRSFFEASEQSSLSSTDVAWGVDEDGNDDGQPRGNFVDAALDAPLPSRAPLWPALPPLLTDWARVEASDASPDPFCPPIQRPPIGLSPCHKRGRGVSAVGSAEKGEPCRRWG